MKKKVKVSDLIDIQVMSHQNLDEPLKRQEVANILRENNIDFYPSINGNCHDVAVSKRDLLRVKTIPDHFLLDDESNEISLGEIKKYLEPESESDFIFT